MEIINIISIAIAIVSTLWGIRHWKSKKNMELFSQRLNIKAAIDDFLYAIFGQNVDMQKEWAVLNSRTREARYLFGSEILQFIIELKDIAAKYNVARIGQKEARNEVSRSKYKVEYLCLLRSLSDLRERLDGLFDKYLILK